MMAVYSFLGFSTAFLAPLVFGMTLDLAGGNQSVTAWGLAFASIGIFGAVVAGGALVVFRGAHKPSTNEIKDLSYGFAA